jgi:hypothetical protein
MIVDGLVTSLQCDDIMCNWTSVEFRVLPAGRCDIMCNSGISGTAGWAL